MPDVTPKNHPLPPPAGDVAKAERYLNWLSELVQQDKIEIIHTDLKKFNSPSLQDHYQIQLKDYIVEVSHNCSPDTGRDTYVMLFNNIQKVQDGSANKVILAYIPLNEQQFLNFRSIADIHEEHKRRIEEEKRFREALMPFDRVLEDLSTMGEAQPAQVQETPAQTVVPPTQPGPSTVNDPIPADQPAESTELVDQPAVTPPYSVVI